MKKRIVKDGEVIHILGKLIHDVNTSLLEKHSLAELGYSDRVALWQIIEQRLPFNYSKRKFNNAYNMLCNTGISLEKPSQEFRYFYGPKELALDLLQIVPELFEGHELDTLEKVETARRMIEAIIKMRKPTDQELEILARLYDAIKRSSPILTSKFDYNFETLMKLL